MHPGFSIKSPTGPQWTSTSIAGVKAWYRADLGTVIATGVSQWNDQSGNGNHLVQATGANQPIVVIGQNNLAALRFDSVNDFMTVGFVLAQPMTVFIVYKLLTVGDGVVHDIIFDGWNNSSMVLATDSSNVCYIYGGTALGTLPLFSNKVYSYCTLNYNGGSSYMRTQGAQTASGNAGAASAGGFSIGGAGGGAGAGSRWSNIEVSEIIITNTTPSATELQLTESYLKNKYGL